MPGDDGDTGDEGIDDVGTAAQGDAGGTDDEGIDDVGTAAPRRRRCRSRIDSLLESTSTALSAMFSNGFM